MKQRIFVGDTELHNVHDEKVCKGEPCVIHNPSDHHMREWVLNWRNDRKIFERLCPIHGVGHPDPDQFAYWKRMGREYEMLHGCCGCCLTTGEKITRAKREEKEMSMEDRYEATNDDAYERYNELAPDQPAANMCLAQFKYKDSNDPDQWHVCTRVTKHEGDHICHSGVCGADISRADHLKQMVNSKDYHPDSVYGREFVLQAEVLESKREAARTRGIIEGLTEQRDKLVTERDQLQARNDQLAEELNQIILGFKGMTYTLANALGHSGNYVQHDILDEAVKAIHKERRQSKKEQETSYLCGEQDPKSVAQCLRAKGHQGYHDDLDGRLWRDPEPKVQTEEPKPKSELEDLLNSFNTVRQTVGNLNDLVKIVDQVMKKS
ncbi:hypothetical protein SEA_SIXAMA_186 [Gordonia phage Sixama]|uniref:Uncharacterized protein n=1 Tax=Gordonia phage Sixama TaxID=2653271 RepID=A0A5Q2F871_9CAUD|nr:hypothetical protein PP302_gp143 [Gordonia phage Sixama]QGF20336.1 hypothetical protein SEA_SIXAMA_186 [Gordonia phage Sixama]